MAKVKLDTTEAHGCARDPSHKGPFFRHHKGNDGLLSRYNVAIAKRYDKYEDCVRLCLDCHCEIHYLYQIRILDYWVNKTARGARHIRNKCIKLCDQWLKGLIVPVEVPVEFREMFRQKYRNWKYFGSKSRADRIAEAKALKKLYG